MNCSIKKLKKGVKYVNVTSSVTKNELTSLNGITDGLNESSKVKFIPASGAATRMFRDLYNYLDNQVDTTFINHFFDQLESFAFYEELRNL